MKKHPLFSELSQLEYNEFIKVFTKKEIKKDTTLVKEGENGDSAFLLIEGKVSVIKESIYGEDYIVTIIDAKGDEFFGEVNLIDKGKRTSTIKTIEDSVILEIDSKSLYNFTDKNPIIGYKIFKYLSQNIAKHLRKADNDVITLFNALVEVVEND
jgi:CRP-like cAMP-binding protein